ncbi:hypothetical protein ACFL04_02130 [Patescibacteria group bacterium]
MTDLKTINLSVHGLEIKCNINDDNFLNFIKNNYSLFVTENISHADIVLNYSVPIKNITGKYISPSVIINKNSILYDPLLSHRHTKLTANMNYHDDQLDVTAQYYEPMMVKILSLINRKTFQLQMYQRIIRFLLHYPLFWLLERDGFSIIHAATVAKNDEALIFTGANGSGKTTLALSLLNDGYKLMADNFTLYKDDKVYAFPEVVRIANETATLIGRKVSGNKVFGKYHLNLNEHELTNVAIIKKIFFVESSPNFELNKINDVSLAEKIEQMHEETKEFHYHSPIKYLNNIVSNPITNDTRGQRLRRLLSSTEKVLLAYNRPAKLSAINKQLI